MKWYKTGTKLTCSMVYRRFICRAKLPNGKVVNIYRANQKHSANEWNFYYYRGHRFLITEQDYSNSVNVD